LVPLRSLRGKALSVRGATFERRIRIERTSIMGLFNAELFKNLAIGFGLGALAITVFVATQLVMTL
jgi:hypothetical protein